MNNENIHIAMSAISSYIYKRYGEEILISYLINRDNDFDPICIRIFLSEKDPEFPINYEKAYLTRNELISEGHALHIFEYYGVENVDFTIHIFQTNDNIEEIPNSINAEYDKHRILFEEYTYNTRKSITTILNTFCYIENDKPVSVAYQFDWDENKHILILTIIYEIYSSINDDIRKILNTQIINYGEYISEPSRFLRSISPSIIMQNDILYK